MNSTVCEFDLRMVWYKIVSLELLAALNLLYV